MPETTKQGEDRVIKGMVDNFLDNYRIAESDRERAKVDHGVKEALRPLGPESYEKFLGYYEKHKSEEHE